LKWLQR